MNKNIYAYNDILIALTGRFLDSRLSFEASPE